MSQDKNQDTSITDTVIDVEPQIISETAEAKPRVARRLMVPALAIAALSAVGGGWLYRDVLSNYFPNDRIVELSKRLDGLESSKAESTKRIDAIVALTDELKSKLSAAEAATQNGLKAVSEMQGQTADNATAIASLNATLDETKSQLLALKSAAPVAATSPADAGLVARVEMLEKDVASLKAVGPSSKPDTAALSQSLADLKAKIANGNAFVDDLTRVSRMVPAAEGLDVLTAEAAQGLPNAAQLALELDAIAKDLPKSDAPQAATGGWFDSMGAWLGQLVTVKTLGSSDFANMAAQASAFAAAGDLARAGDVFASAENALPAPLQQWRDTAARRLRLEQALEKTASAVLRELAARG